LRFGDLECAPGNANRRGNWNMATLKELIAQKEALEKEISATREKEYRDAIAKVKSMVAEFGLTAGDVFGAGRPARKPGKTGMKVAPKYRDPASGKTWTGRGVAPAWIKDRNRDDFLIR
jgi:DNA-binding protein H-NS